MELRQRHRAVRPEMPVRTLALLALASVVWLGIRRAGMPVGVVPPMGERGEHAERGGTGAPGTPDGIADLVLEAFDTAGAPVLALDVTLERRGTVQRSEAAGRRVAADGSGADGSGADRPGADAVVRSLRSDDGHFVVDGLAQGEWRLTITSRYARVLEPAAGTPVTLPRVLPLTVRTETPAALEVEARDCDGQPLSGVEILVQSVGDAGIVRATDALGRVRSGPLPVGPVEVVARLAGAEARQRVMLTPQSRVVLPVRLPGGSLVGRALDATGRPLGQRRVEVRSATALDGAAPLAMATTDGAGRFEVPWLPPGPVVVRLADAPQPGLRAGQRAEQLEGVSLGPTASVRVDVLDCARAEAQLTLPAAVLGCSLRGRLLYGSEPLVEVELTFVAEQRGGAATPSPRARTARTDRAGRFAVELDHTGPWAVLAALPDRPSLALGAFEAGAPGAVERDLFVPVGTLEGRVVDVAGQGLAGVRIECVPATPWAHGGLHGRPASTVTAADGSFELPPLLAGPWIVHASPEDPAFARLATEAVEVRPDGSSPALDLVAPPAGSLRVRLAGLALDTGDAAHVEVRDAGGRYVLPRPLALRGALADGALVQGLAAGTYRCAVRLSSRVSEWSAPIAVRPGEESAVEVALRPGGTLELALRDASGAPCPAGLELLDSRGESVTRLAEPTSEAPGRYRLGPLPAGRYTLVARGLDGATVRRELELVAGAASTLELRLGG